jgi:hypothetical protein
MPCGQRRAIKVTRRTSSGLAVQHRNLAARRISNSPTVATLRRNKHPYVAPPVEHMRANATHRVALLGNEARHVAIATITNARGACCKSAQLVAALTSSARPSAYLWRLRRLRRSSSPQRPQSHTPRRASAATLVSHLPSLFKAAWYPLPRARAQRDVHRRLVCIGVCVCDVLCMRACVRPQHEGAKTHKMGKYSHRVLRVPT